MCSKCGNPQETIFTYIPRPDFETGNDPYIDAYINDKHVCPCCHKEYIMTYRLSAEGGKGEIEGLCDDVPVKVQEDCGEEEYYFNLFEDIKGSIREERKDIDLFHKRMVSIVDLIVTFKLSEPEKKILYPMLYVNMIASMEAYLADTFIKSVLESEENKRKFVEAFDDFKKVQISFQRIYEKMNGMDKLISQTLHDVIFHNLPKVSGMYRDTLGINLGDIKELMKAVNKRHDIVHRNCVDKYGNDVIVKKKDVKELFERVMNFVDAIEAQVHPEPTV